MRSLERHAAGPGSLRLRSLIVLATAVLVMAFSSPSRADLKDVIRPARTVSVCEHDSHGAITGPCHDVLIPAFPNAGECTSYFRKWHFGDTGHEDNVDVCLDFMGITKYCNDRDASVTVGYVAAPGTWNGDLRILQCTARSHPDDVVDQFVRIWTGIGQGLITAAPFVGEAVAAAACIYGQIYACAVLALDVSTQAGLKIPGEVGEAIQVAAQVPQCLDGDVVACAKFGVHGAKIVGLDIPGVDQLVLGEDVAKCATDDFAACMRLGQAASEASGIDVTKIVGVLGNAQDCADGKKEACIALGKEAVQGTPLNGVPGGFESAEACRNGSRADCEKLGTTLASLASGPIVEAPFVSQFGANTCTSYVSSKNPVDLASIWDDRSATSIAVFPSDGAHFSAPFHASKRNGGWSAGAKWAAADFTGDGSTDALAAWDDAGSTTLTVRQSTGRGFAAVHWATRVGTWADTTVWLPGDFDGDGHMDVAAVWKQLGQTSIDVYLSDGARFRAPMQWVRRIGRWDDETKWTSGDFNGDGKSDLASIWNNGGRNALTVWQSMDSRFAPVNWAGTPGRSQNKYEASLERAPWTADAGGWSATTVWLAGDYNGDGHLDLAAVWHDGDATSIAVYPSSGSNFTGWTQWSQRDGGWIDKAKWASGDFNGDGKTDIAAIWNHGGSNTLTVRQSNGSSFAQAHWAIDSGGWSPSAAWCVGQFPRSFGASDTYNEASAKARHDSMRASLPAGTVSEVDNQRPDSAVQPATASSQPPPIALGRVALPPKALGRAAPRGPVDPNKTMCDYARSAKARNSPAAPALEKRCLEGGGSMTPPVPPSP